MLDSGHSRIRRPALIQNAFHVGESLVDPRRDLIERHGNTIKIEPRAMQVLAYLVENAGEVVSREQILEAVWEGTFVTDEVLTNAIGKLRRAFGEEANDSGLIQTVPKKGYRLNASVSPVEGSFAFEERGLPEPKRISRRALWAALGAVISAVAVYLAVPLARDTRQIGASAVQGTFSQLTSEPGEELFPSLSPDGRFIAYTSRAAGNWDVYVRRVQGRNATNLTPDSPADDTQPAFSPDGELIVFRSERDGGGIFLMGATGESVRRLTDFGYDPVWSPDGREILFATAPTWWPVRWKVSELWAIDIATGERRLIAGKDASQPRWSPHGHRVAYFSKNFSKKTDHPGIWTISAKGGEALRVTDGAYVNWNPVWSPDGSYIYFSSDRSGSMNLWRVAIEEESGKILSEPEPVTTGAGASAVHPTLSGDGRRIAYASRGVENFNLYKIAFDETAEKVQGEPVAITRGSNTAIGPSASPDGEWLAFSSRRPPHGISLIRTDGTGIRQLTDARDRHPQWSPDGERIAFQSYRSGTSEIWIVNPDGSGLQQVTNTPGYDASFPVWSADGLRIAYTLFPQVWSYVVELGKPWTETLPEAMPPFEGKSERLQVMSWSPDGRRLALHSLDESIILYDLESKEYRQLTDFGTRPVWLNDSHRLLFTERTQGKFFILDSESKEYREIFAPGALMGHPVELTRVSRTTTDDRAIYFSLVSRESDIWLLTLEKF